jgi:putative transposase
MPRTARAVEGGLIYHVLNRGNGRLRLFRKEGDFVSFEKVLAEGLQRYPVELLTYCLMKNHWHLVLRPRTDESLGRLMGWIGVTHVRRHYAHYHLAGGGHLYQGRFKSFPVQDDRHLLALCRYVEGNAVRAKCVERAHEWRWGGLFARMHGGKPFKLCDWPVDRPGNWVQLVNRTIEKADLERLRVSVKRGRPFGEDDWIEKTARRLGLSFTLTSVGRPRKTKNE